MSSAIIVTPRYAISTLDQYGSGFRDTRRGPRHAEQRQRRAERGARQAKAAGPSRQPRTDVTAAAVNSGSPSTKTEAARL
jgi:hypothetical protein